MAIKYHPDKIQNGNMDENVRKEWEKMQEAYQVLMDEEKRIAYDSTLDFDDSVGENYDPSQHDFFEHFGPLFRMN